MIPGIVQKRQESRAVALARAFGEIGLGLDGGDFFGHRDIDELVHAGPFRRGNAFGRAFERGLQAQGVICLTAARSPASGRPRDPPPG